MTVQTLIHHLTPQQIHLVRTEEKATAKTEEKTTDVATAFNDLFNA
jgi:hypothetical protein